MSGSFRKNSRKYSRSIHLWLSLVIFIPVIIVIASGLLLQVKKEFDWIQPPTQKVQNTQTNGPTISFDEVLMVGEGESAKVGAPHVADAAVKVEVLSHGRGDKVRIVKHRRRKHYHKEQGHRQHFTEVKITEIVGA